MAFKPPWGARIAEARRAHELSQAKLARLIDVGVIQVSRWERGVALPNDLNRLRLAQLFGTTVAELFPYPEETPEDGANGEAA